MTADEQRRGCAAASVADANRKGGNRANARATGAAALCDLQGGQRGLMEAQLAMQSVYDESDRPGQIGDVAQATGRRVYCEGASGSTEGSEVRT